MGFLRSLLDMSFTSLITRRVISVLYALGMVAIAFLYLIFVVSAFRASAFGGVVVLLIFGPLLSLAYLIYIRVILEVIIVLFKIYENTSILAEGPRAFAPTSAVPPPPMTAPPPPPPSSLG